MPWKPTWVAKASGKLKSRKSSKQLGPEKETVKVQATKSSVDIQEEVGSERLLRKEQWPLKSPIQFSSGDFPIKAPMQSKHQSELQHILRQIHGEPVNDHTRDKGSTSKDDYPKYSRDQYLDALLQKENDMGDGIAREVRRHWDAFDVLNGPDPTTGKRLTRIRAPGHDFHVLWNQSIDEQPLDTFVRAAECQLSRQEEVYRPVPTSSQIRLLRLLPPHMLKAKQDTLQAVLEDYSLESDGSNDPAYETLSYANKTLSKTGKIAINGHPVKISTSLESALRQLRSSEKTMLLWCEEICIDSSSSEEMERRFEQGPLIFGRAKRSILWLGSATKQNCAVFQNLQDLKVMANLAQKEKQNFDILRKGSTWSVLEEFLHTPILDKSWILQGALFSENCVLRCGGDEMSLWDIMDAYNLLDGT